MHRRLAACRQGLTPRGADTSIRSRIRQSSIYRKVEALAAWGEPGSRAFSREPRARAQDPLPSFSFSCMLIPTEAATFNEMMSPLITR